MKRQHLDSNVTLLFYKQIIKTTDVKDSNPGKITLIQSTSFTDLFLEMTICHCVAIV